MVACPDCATIQVLPPLRQGGTLKCCRCDNTLERATGRSLNAALACSLATLLLLFPANLLPLLHVSIFGVGRESRLGSGVVAIWNEGWPLMAIVIGAQGVVLPFFRFAVLTTVLATLRFGRRGWWTGAAFRWSERLDKWSMPDVFLIGCVVGYSRVAPFLPISIEAGGWCFVAAALLSMLSRALLDRQAIWRRIRIGLPEPRSGAVACTVCDLVLPAEFEGSRCPCCRAHVWRRRPMSLHYAAALVATGFLLYPVANIFPMSTQYSFLEVHQHTIASGVEQLVAAHLWPLAVLIFTTSIAIPLLKLIGMTWLMLSVRHRSRRMLVFKTRLYRIIDEIGRWSNVDVFTIVVFVPLMHFGPFLQVTAAGGAAAFLTVIVVSMIAVRVFDPRLLWDSVGPAR